MLLEIMYFIVSFMNKIFLKLFFFFFWALHSRYIFLYESLLKLHFVSHFLVLAPSLITLPLKLIVDYVLYSIENLLMACSWAVVLAAQLGMGLLPPSTLIDFLLQLTIIYLRHQDKKSE